MMATPEKPQRSLRKKSYSRPVLRKYGSVAKLTSIKSLGTNDGSGGKHKL
jgi:hypothetical protein